MNGPKADLARIIDDIRPNPEVGRPWRTRDPAAISV
jgi:hypothetical protein